MEGIYFDIVIATILTIFAVKGLDEGFIGSNKFLIAVVASVYVGSKYQDVIMDKIGEFLNISSSSLQAVSLLATFLFFLLVAYVVALFFKLFVIGGGAISLYDKLFGLIFSVVKIGLILSLVLYTVSSFIDFSEDIDEALSESYSYDLLSKAGLAIAGDNMEFSTESMTAFVSKLFNIGMDSNSVLAKGVQDGLGQVLQDKSAINEVAKRIIGENSNEKSQ